MITVPRMKRRVMEEVMGLLTGQKGARCSPLTMPVSVAASRLLAASVAAAVETLLATGKAIDKKAGRPLRTAPGCYVSLPKA